MPDSFKAVCIPYKAQYKCSALFLLYLYQYTRLYNETIERIYYTRQSPWICQHQNCVGNVGTQKRQSVADV